MKKIKAFTLIELIVVMAIMSGLMLAIMKIFDPVNALYADTKVISHQREVESGIAQYICENVRNSSSVGVYQGSGYTAQSAVSAFLANNPTDYKGNPIDAKQVDVIGIIYSKDFAYQGNTYKGRVIRKRQDATYTFNEATFSSDGSTDFYVAMGDAYYGTADYYVQIKDFSAAGMDIQVDSDYFYGNSRDRYLTKTSGGSNTSNLSKRSVKFENPNIKVNGSTGSDKTNFTYIIDDSGFDDEVGSRTKQQNTYIVFFKDQFYI